MDKDKDKAMLFSCLPLYQEVVKEADFAEPPE